MVQFRIDGKLCQPISEGQASITAHGHTVAREFEERRQISDGTVLMTRVWETRIRISEFVKERVNHCFDGGEPLSRSILQQARDEVDGIRVCLAEHLQGH